MPNWVLDATLDLSKCSDIKVLVFLARRSGYQNSSFGPGRISDETGLDYRTVCSALSHLASLGHVVSLGGEHCLRGACASLAHRLYKAQRKTTHTPQAENPEQEQENEKPISVTVTPNELKRTEEKKEKKKTKQPVTADAAPVSSDSTPFQQMFGALALTCYGGHDALTNQARSRVGKAAKSLIEAGYAPTDVPHIVAWIGTHEPWRTGGLAPQTIEERAPAWKSGARGNLPLAARTDDTTTEANDEFDMAALINSAPLNGTTRRRA